MDPHYQKSGKTPVHTSPCSLHMLQPYLHKPKKKSDTIYQIIYLSFPVDLILLTGDISGLLLDHESKHFLPPPVRMFQNIHDLNLQVLISYVMCQVKSGQYSSRSVWAFAQSDQRVIMSAILFNKIATRENCMDVQADLELHYPHMFIHLFVCLHPFLHNVG